MTGEEAVYAPVRTLMLYLTEDCNLRCTYCFVNKKARRMSSQTARKAIEFYFNRNISGAEYQVGITFFGGEPFTELELMEEVVAIAREPRPNVYKKPYFTATTNGTVSSPRAERIIRDAQMALLVSMDGGAHAATYRPFVSGRSSFEVVAHNLPRLAAWSPDVVVRMTFHPDALDLVGNVKQVLESGAPSVALCPVVEADWNGHEERLEEAYQALADWYITEARKGRILPLEVTHSLIQQSHVNGPQNTRPDRACAVGAYILGVDPDGNVMPCHRFLYRPQDWLGTVDQPQLNDERLPYLHLSSRNISGCDACVARPMCGGGCRAVARNAGYQLNQPHPNYCLLTRAHARAVRHIYDTLTAEMNPAFLATLRATRPGRGALSELLR